jgi:hypothetical protein
MDHENAGSPESSDMWNEAANVYRKRGLVIVVGAGVSVASGFPTWAQLLRRLAERCIGSAGAELVEELEKIGFSYPAIAGIIRSNWHSDSGFLEVVREELYRDFPFFRGLLVLQKREFVDFVKHENSTLRAVAALCAARSADGKFVPNPLIHALVNFNLDAVLREYSENRYDVRLLRTIERASATASSSRINTYYIHGFLQFDDQKIGAPDAEADTIVFTEGEYYDFFGKPFGMFSYTLLHLLREHPCLFIGLSMIDENLRRLLHYSGSERVRSYEAEGLSHDEACSESLRHFAVLCHTSSEAVDQAIERSLADLSVRVTWLNKFEELPDRLGQIYSSTGATWDDVY